nr:hypothetical protein GCM10025732_05120 [Glycomyces mayteni]
MVGEAPTGRVDEREVRERAAARHVLGERDGAQRRQRQAAQARQERRDDRDDRDHGRLRVAGEPGDELAVPGARQEHREPWADGDGVEHVLGADLGERGVQVVDGADHGPAGGADDVGAGEGLAQGGDVRFEGVLDRTHAVLDVGADEEVRDHRPEGVADAAFAGDAAGEQLVAEDDDAGARAPVRGQRQVARGGGQADHRRRDGRARGHELLALPRLLTGLAPFARGGAFDVAVGDGAVLQADEAVGALGDLRAGRDLHGRTGSERIGDLPGEDLAADAPRRGPGDGPAVDRGGRERGQVGDRGQGRGERGPGGLPERQLGRGRFRGIACGPSGLAGVGPGDRVGHAVLPWSPRS